VNSVFTPADSAADLRALHGPLAAPWWERVAWGWVIAVALVLALLVALIARLRRRRPVVPVVAPVATAPRRDPGAEALAELAALRRLQLPEHGRFSEHAFHLTRILRRYLELTAGGVRPGDTTTELLTRLGGGAVAAPPAAPPRPAADLSRLEGLLRLWDRIKFARASSTLDESRRTEGAVEALVRAPGETPRQEVA
jgi:hypothetical protein